MCPFRARLSHVTDMISKPTSRRQHITLMAPQSCKTSRDNAFTLPRRWQLGISNPEVIPSFCMQTRFDRCRRRHIHTATFLPYPCRLSGAPAYSGVAPGSRRGAHRPGTALTLSRPLPLPRTAGQQGRHIHTARSGRRRPAAHSHPWRATPQPALLKDCCACCRCFP